MVTYSIEVGQTHFYFPLTPDIVHFHGGEAREFHFHKGTKPPRNEDISVGCAFYHTGANLLFIYNGTLWEAQTIILEEFTWNGSSSITTANPYVAGTTRIWLADTYIRPGIRYYETPNETITFWNSNLANNGTPCAVEYRRAILTPS